MAIEVRQLVIKSTVVREEPHSKLLQVPTELNLQKIKEAILVECKEAIADALRERQER